MTSMLEIKKKNNINKKIKKLKKNNLKHIRQKLKLYQKNIERNRV